MGISQQIAGLHIENFGAANFLKIISPTLMYNKRDDAIKPILNKMILPNDKDRAFLWDGMLTPVIYMFQVSWSCEVILGTDLHPIIIHGLIPGVKKNFLY